MLLKLPMFKILLKLIECKNHGQTLDPESGIVQHVFISRSRGKGDWQKLVVVSCDSTAPSADPDASVCSNNGLERFGILKM